MVKPSYIFIASLLLALGLLQYKLWFSQEGISRYWQLKNQIAAMRTDNASLQARNAHVIAEVENLKQGDDAIEERARNDLALVKADEVFYQIVP
jgi:cell division protein FtsB